MPPDAPATETPTENTTFGLSADEQAVYEGMRSQGPATGDPGFVDPETPAEPEPAAEPAVEPTPAPIGEDPTTAKPPLEAVADDDDEPEALPDGTKPPKRVSYNRFRQAEEALKAEREKNAKSAETQTRLDERLRLINEALTQQPAAVEEVDQDPEPDPETDIFAHNAWLRRQLVATRESFDSRLQQIETGQQESVADRNLTTAYMDDAQRFAQAEPNFGPAYVYLMQVRMAQLASFHFGKDLTDPNAPQLTIPETAQIKAEIAREEKALVSNALKGNRSPAAEVFKMARMTGYRPSVAPAAPAPTNGASPPLVPAAAAPAPNGAAPKPSVTAVIDGIKAGTEASRSLSHGGGAPAPILDMKKLADMNGDDFAVFLESTSREGLRRAMGGGD